VLRALALQLVRAGRSEEAVAHAELAVAAHPDVAAFHEIRGRVLLEMGAMDAAHVSLSRAVELDPSNVDALLELAEAEAKGAALEAALALCDRAADADPESAEPRWVAIELIDRYGASEAGTSEPLADRLEALLAMDPAHARAATRLALLLADRGTDLDRALELAHRGVRFGAGPEAWDAVGRVQLQRGDAEAAVAAYRRALGRRPDSASTRYQLGSALAASGQSAEAREAFRDALASGEFPEAAAARAALAQLEDPAAASP
jgi:tetratricopeptide (TPR) repeat protein